MPFSYTRTYTADVGLNRLPELARCLADAALFVGKAIYGLKQSSRCWNSNIDSTLKQLGLVKSINDPCLYLKTEGNVVLVGLYVDDLLIASSDVDIVSSIKCKLSDVYDVKDLGKLTYFLGVEVKQLDNGYWIGQSQYCRKLLYEFGMTNSKNVSTPMESNVQLHKASNDNLLADKAKYNTCIGALLYLSTKRPGRISRTLLINCHNSTLNLQK